MGPPETKMTTSPFGGGPLVVGCFTKTLKDDATPTLIQNSHRVNSWPKENERERLCGGRHAGQLRSLRLGRPAKWQDPAIVAERLRQIMAPRPLLRLDSEDTPILLDAMPAVHERVAEETPQLMQDLREDL